MRLAMWSIKKKMYTCKIAEMRCVCLGSVPTTFSMVVNDSIIRIYPGLGDTKLKYRGKSIGSKLVLKSMQIKTRIKGQQVLGTSGFSPIQPPPKSPNCQKVGTPDPGRLLRAFS